MLETDVLLSYAGFDLIELEYSELSLNPVNHASFYLSLVLEQPGQINSFRIWH